MKKLYSLSIRAYFPNGGTCTHYQDLALKDIAKWVEAYQFTHPDVEAITVKIWLHDEEKNT